MEGQDDKTIIQYQLEHIKELEALNKQYHDRATEVIARNYELSARIKALERENKMINVKERLPDANQMVLCYGMGKRWFTALYQLDQFLYFTGDFEFDVAEEVTHWRSLPENPSID